MRVRSRFLVVVLLAAGVAACSAPPQGDQVPLVQQAFEGFKDQIALEHAHGALAYLDQPTRAYLEGVALREPSVTDPEIDQLIHRAAVKLTPQGMGPGFSVEQPLQRLLDKGLISPSDLAVLTIGPVAVDATGQHAHAEALWLGHPTTLPVLFNRVETGEWKINLLNLLTYASAALTMDRTLKRETEDQQLDRLVRIVPNP
jgi:hypothetical protein